jgi:hypothetical protein
MEDHGEDDGEGNRPQERMGDEEASATTIRSSTERKRIVARLLFMPEFDSARVTEGLALAKQEGGHRDSRPRTSCSTAGVE